MGAKDRMILVKSTILSLLKNAYEKRDKVGMVAFRKNAAEELLPVTRSISLANKKLENLPTGGRTPLYDGLYKAYRLLKNEIRKNPKVIPILILITDGRYNVFQGDNPTKDILELCKT
ncbi:MAG: VWA domain-containing protein, partial [Cetobacterium sp.]